jgi:hypothetical protein
MDDKSLLFPIVNPKAARGITFTVPVAKKLSLI